MFRLSSSIIIIWPLMHGHRSIYLIIKLKKSIYVTSFFFFDKSIYVTSMTIILYLCHKLLHLWFLLDFNLHFSFTLIFLTKSNALFSFNNLQIILWACWREKTNGLIALFPPIFCQLCDFASHCFNWAILHPIFFLLSGLEVPWVF